MAERVANRSRVYRDGTLVGEDLPLSELAAHRERGDLVWLDLVMPTAEQIERTSDALGIDLHPLAIENALAAHQRPKLVRAEGHSYLHLYLAAPLDGGGLALSAVSAFLSPQVFLTIDPSGGLDFDELSERCDENPDLFSHGVAFLLYTLLDAVVDGYFTVIDDLDEDVGALEDALFEPDTRQNQLQTFTVRKSLSQLARVVMPMHEVLSTLLRRGVNVVEDELLPYFQDVYDHALRAGERVDGLRDLLGSIIATNLAMQGNRLNDIMKKLAAWGAVVAIPTMITGYFGQNVPFPGFGNSWGLLISTVAIVALAGAAWLGFRNRDWL
ncbi:magnesium transporter CorA family protein [Rhodococcus sp. D2-41]|uniref:Magnesium transporter CorA family protein n=1 Tax=Speluncibacter jeojiensis TaxID=2710754 RepID=A0A9X4M117_9ACTN|nr:magnesium transporter CorA family protein [Rhodococcus sp. D2-41]MDG3011619.1 magnesium transporter CorA family protein [Rhodococcus sp. D2-41]MDG3015025.1 magnesium transporter CorA family protein [Corynebacteriales bacterium D3-21]